jgi:hypothetical protein
MKKGKNNHICVFHILFLKIMLKALNGDELKKSKPEVYEG